jgi:hypothetical protein
MSYIYGAAANANKWQMGFNLAFKGLNYIVAQVTGDGDKTVDGDW